MLKRAKSFLGKTKTKEEFDLSESSHLRRHTTITTEVIQEQQVYRARERRRCRSKIEENFKNTDRQEWCDPATDNPVAEAKNSKETYRKSVDGSRQNLETSFLEEMKKKLLMKQSRLKPPKNEIVDEEEPQPHPWEPHPTRRVQRSKSTLDRPSAANKRLCEISDRKLQF